MSRDALPHHRRTVVLGEGDALLADRAGRALDQAGWAVIRASSAEGVARALSIPPTGAFPDALVVDFGLPGAPAGGLDRLLARWPALPAVVIAAEGAAAAPAPDGVPVVRADADLDALGVMLTWLVADRRRSSAPSPHAAPRAPPPARHEVRGPVVGDVRAETRFPLDHPVHVSLWLPTEELPRDAFVHAVSAAGLVVRHVGAGSAVGSALTIEFHHLRDARATLRVPAVVRWTQRVDNGNDTGVEFTSPDGKPARRAVYGLLVDD